MFKKWLIKYKLYLINARKQKVIDFLDKWKYGVQFWQNEWYFDRDQQKKGDIALAKIDYLQSAYLRRVNKIIKNVL